MANHPDLIDNLEEGFDFYNNNNITSDDTFGHGTFVAGIIGAKGNNNVGICGVNWNVSIMPLQICDEENNVDYPSCIAAINHATNSYQTSNPIRILNFSIAMTSEQSLFYNSILAYPGLFVCASGNYGQNMDLAMWCTYPSYYSSNHIDSPLTNMLVVSASDSNDYRGKWGQYTSSNYGVNNVDIYAPGVGIISTFPENLNNRDSEMSVSTGYKVLSGTSYATPVVAGVAALLLSVNPNLTTAQLKEVILESTDEIIIKLDYIIHNDTSQNVIGPAKRINAYKAFEYVLKNYPTLTIAHNENCETRDIYLDPESSIYYENIAYIKFNALEAQEYRFIIDAESPITVKFYNNNFNEFQLTPTITNEGCKIEFSRLLLMGSYYITIEYNTTNNLSEDVIELSIYLPTHEHDYSGWRYYSNTAHIEVCECGMLGTTTKVHVVRASEIVDNKANCIECNHMLDLYSDIAGIIGTQSVVRMYTLNGSYILLNGIIVLVDEDIEAYQNGTLVFYNNNNDLKSE